MTGRSFPPQARRRFGQNFLQDATVIDRIVKAIAPRPDQCLVEVGPGRGAITQRLLEEAGQLQVVEIDRDLAEVLRRQYASHPGFILHEADVLDFDFNSIDDASSLRIVGNLPYNLSTPLLFHLLKFHSRIQDMIFMLQLEVVQRMAAPAGDRHYGRLSLMMQYYCRVEQLFTVPPSAFQPQPKVESAMVRLVPHAQLPCPARDTEVLSEVIRTAFNQRRKTIRNSLKTLLPEAQLRALDIDINQRPENLSLEEYVRISDSLTR